ncbi:MAG TPA: hypothetical protein VKY89_09875 [Thermoanaerobaculia bacterium]|nr:hypothetical protein [Thermoanaerobaculia bacterium]
MTRIGRGLVLACLVPLSALAAATAAAAGPPPSPPPPPTPRRFVDNLDVRCYQLGELPPLNLPLTLKHLDPVLEKLGLVRQEVVLGAPQQLCLPVFKNNTPPPPDTLPFLRYVDWSCYGITGEPVNLPVHVTQLNPLLAKLFGDGPVDVLLLNPRQLCVPVMKSKVPPPPLEVQHLVQFLDVECFAVKGTQSVAGKTLLLNHLNPLFAGLPEEKAAFLGEGPTQLCVPVAKDGQVPPPDVLPYVESADVLCYAMGGKSLAAKVTLTQLDPVLVAKKVQPVTVTVGEPAKVCVPVAKNGELPKGAP